MKILIVGAGGVTSYLLPILIRSVDRLNDTIVVMDGDRLEERNLDRQLFDPHHEGEFKAQVLADMYGVEAFCGFLNKHSNLSSYDWLLVAVDNHKARKLALEQADLYDIPIIIGANEYTDAEAYYYDILLQGSKVDPRIRWPEILSDESNDPVSCQGSELIASPQLAISNALVAAYMMHLFYFYLHRAEKVFPENQPVHHTSNFAKTQTYTYGDLVK